MSGEWRWLCVALCIMGTALAGCGDDGGECLRGTLGCRCLPEDDCGSGLACLSDTCVAQAVADEANMSDALIGRSPGGSAGTSGSRATGGNGSSSSSSGGDDATDTATGDAGTAAVQTSRADAATGEEMSDVDAMSDGECASADDCPEGIDCVDQRCQCGPEAKACDMTCIAADECCEPCAAGAMCVDGQCFCPEGQHACAGACVPDDSTDSCGQRCEPCVPPTGGSATCDGQTCGGSCPSGQQLCAGQCIAEGAACTGECPSGSYNCGGICGENKFVCEGQASRRCEPDGTLGEPETCQSGCNSGTGLCRNCVPGAARCSGDSRLVCDAEGEEEEASPCPGHCVGDECVDCTPLTALFDCEGESCSAATCTDDGECDLEPVLAGTPCFGEAGYCDGTGNCEECTGTGKAQCQGDFELCMDGSCVEQCGNGEVQFEIGEKCDPNEPFVPSNVCDSECEITKQAYATCTWSDSNQWAPCFGGTSAFSIVICGPHGGCFWGGCQDDYFCGPGSCFKSGSGDGYCLLPCAADSQCPGAANKCVNLSLGGQALRVCGQTDGLVLP